MDNSYNIITIPEIKTPDQSQGLYNAPIEDTQLNVGNNRDISWMQYFAMTINCTAWATADWTYRVVNLLWLNWVQEKSYAQEILVWLGSTTATFTKTYTVDTPVNSIFKLPPWKVMEVTARLPTSTGLLRMDYTGSLKFLLWSTTDMSSTNTNIVFINSNATTKDITLKYATSASDRPTFGIFIRIY